MGTQVMSSLLCDRVRAASIGHLWKILALYGLPVVNQNGSGHSEFIMSLTFLVHIDGEAKTDKEPAQICLWKTISILSTPEKASTQLRQVCPC